MELFNKMIAAALKVSVHQVDNTLSLLGGGATIPFISRYRKEATGGLDEVQIGEIKDRNDKLCELAKRKETILSTIEEQGKLTEELRKRIEQSWDATEVEDIYLPYKPKRKTRAEAARQKGLEPLATLLLLQRENHLDSRLPAFVKGDVKDEEERRARHHSRTSERGRARPQPTAQPIFPTSCHHLQSGERQRGRSCQIPRLFRFQRTFETLFLPPSAGYPPGRVGRPVESKYKS